MKELFLNVINNGDYELRDMLSKIAERHINNDLTDDEKVELEELARQNAKQDKGFSAPELRLEEAFKRIKELEDRVKVLENNSSTETDEPVEDEEVVEEYPEYKQPTGTHNAYRVGDKITFNGKKYTCIMDYTVYDPVTYPYAWEEVVEQEVVE